MNVKCCLSLFYYVLIVVCELVDYTLLTKAQMYFERTTKSDLGKVETCIKWSYKQVAVELVSCKPQTVGGKRLARELV